MSNIDFFLIAVFTDFNIGHRGNISAVLKLEEAISNEKMQLIAADLNQPATTFIWKEADKWQIRWFAPDSEILLCGHGSMAATAYFELQNLPVPVFNFKNGAIAGKVIDNIAQIDIDRGTFSSAQPPDQLSKILGIPIIEYFETSDKSIVLTTSEEVLKNMEPDFAALKKLAPFGYAVTAKGKTVDFVSRTLVPKVQQLEDHATGSSHTVLVPFWAEKLDKKRFTAHQLSPRGGSFACSLNKERVTLKGQFELIGSGVYCEINE